MPANDQSGTGTEFQMGKAMGAKPSYMPSPIMDDLLTITLELGAELWVVKERVRILEGALEKAGIDARKAIEEYAPDEAERQEVIRLRDAFVQQVYGSLRDRAQQTLNELS